MKVHVHFVGICTHVTENFPGNGEGFTTTQTLTNAKSRVVLVNASQGMNIGGVSIPPHQATLTMNPYFVAGTPLPTVPGATKAVPGTWNLHGVKLEIVNPVNPGQLTVDPQFFLIPGLTISAGVGPLKQDLRMVDDGSAAAVFHVDSGYLTGIQHSSEAVVGRLTVETDGPPQLRITRMWKPSETTILTLQRAKINGVEHDPVIAVTNTGTDDDENIDFLIHYGVTTWTPPSMAAVTPRAASPLVAAEIADEKLIEDILEILGLLPPWVFFGVTYGCSNSIYP